MSDRTDTLSADSLEVQPYQVKLEIFEGPLDLLLHLIEKQELDITKVSLAAVTDQYLQYIGRFERISAQNLADFLVVAVKLLLIKSRALLPALPIAEEEAEDDLGDELVHQLQEYRKFKEVAQQLREREKRGLRAYVRLVSLPPRERKLDMAGVSLEDLVAAMRDMLSLQPTPGPVDEIVAPLVISVADKIQYIESLLSEQSSFNFNKLVREAASRSEVIVAFLALLELVKSQRIHVHQEQLFGEIFIFAIREPSTNSATQEQPEQ